jgi:hypothetical protein
LRKRLAKPAEEHLGAAVHRLERIGHGGGDRRGEQDLAPAPAHHLLEHPLGQRHSADDVEVDHADLLVEIGVDESSAKSDAGVDPQHVDRLAEGGDGFTQLGDAFLAGEIGWTGLDTSAPAARRLWPASARCAAPSAAISRS